MLAVRNDTPYSARIFPWLDVAGVEHAIVVARATHVVLSSGELVVAEEQLDVQLVDEHVGEPGASSLRYTTDVVPTRAGTDVAVVGSARSQRAVTSLEVELRAGPLRKRARVTGDRVWERGPFGLRASTAAPFVELPLVWERAFGGEDRSGGAAAKPRAYDPRNPVGLGFAASLTRNLEGAALPNVEEPAEPLDHPTGVVAPAGFGFVAASWLPRSRYAGTLDDAWRAQRAPLLPLDFDARFFRAAAPGLSSPTPFSGGEPIVAIGMTGDGGALVCEAPRGRLVAHVKLLGRWGAWPMTFDTLVVEPTARRILATYRALVPCPRAFLAIDKVRIEETPG